VLEVLRRFGSGDVFLAHWRTGAPVFCPIAPYDDALTVICYFKANHKCLPLPDPEAIASRWRGCKFLPLFVGFHTKFCFIRLVRPL